VNIPQTVILDDLYLCMCYSLVHVHVIDFRCPATTKPFDLTLLFGRPFAGMSDAIAFGWVINRSDIRNRSSSNTEAQNKLGWHDP